MTWAEDFLSRPDKEKEKETKKRKRRKENQDQRIERKIKEYHMAKARTYYARANYTVAKIALFVASMALICNMLVLLKVFGLIQVGL